MTESPTPFSPTASVRESCRRWMDGAQTGNDESQPSKNCAVTINHDGLDHFAMEISNTILANKSFHVSEWDADGWHYTGKNYRSGSNNEFDVLMRMERVAMYILTMDAINFCFWPTSNANVKNSLEYEHLAVALRKVAELDDVEYDTDSNLGCNSGCGSIIIQSSSSYTLSPRTLSTLTAKQLEDMLMQHLTLLDGNLHFEIPDICIRCQLLNELGKGILDHHSGSALCMIQKANKSADELVNIIMQTFPGFRDFVSDGGISQSSEWEAAKELSSTIHFYKRAQIAVADIWAALGRNQSSLPITTTAFSKFYTCCQFTDMARITTFPDYRVPQILRHVNVLKYVDDLAQKVDKEIELEKGCRDEISIRAGTVVAVDNLVLKVKERILTIVSQSDEEEEKKDLLSLADDVSSVTLDWYLWQQGEKLDRENLLESHHRVRTTFY